MDFADISVGVDIEENIRFSGKLLENDLKLLEKIFTPKELEYCFSDKNSAQHLTARYCAKEATVKALYGIGVKDVYYSDIEVLNNDDGVPYIKISKYPDIKIKVSLSHTKTNSVATVLLSK